VAITLSAAGSILDTVPLTGCPTDTDPPPNSTENGLCPVALCSAALILALTARMRGFSSSTSQPLAHTRRNPVMIGVARIHAGVDLAITLFVAGSIRYSQYARWLPTHTDPSPTPTLIGLSSGVDASTPLAATPSH
jgi:hypothetical protein